MSSCLNVCKQVRIMGCKSEELIKTTLYMGRVNEIKIQILFKASKLSKNDLSYLKWVEESEWYNTSTVHVYIRLIWFVHMWVTDVVYYDASVTSPDILSLFPFDIFLCKPFFFKPHTQADLLFINIYIKQIWFHHCWYIFNRKTNKHIFKQSNHCFRQAFVCLAGN